MVDRRTIEATARGGAPRGLSPRAERVCRAAIEAMLADEDPDGRLVPASPAACDRAVLWMTSAAGVMSGDLRRGLGLLTFALQVLPIVVIGAPRRMTSLSLADRVRYLSALETHRIGLFAMLAIAFKVPMCIAAFEEGEELASTGFDRPDTVTRRGLLLAQAAQTAEIEAEGSAAG
ncbi:MAG: hypothetical protein U0441_31965 [Polyangiaceae bacterium]